MDEHLSGNILTKDLANEIFRVKPYQRIALTTTNPSYRTSTETDFVGLNHKDILLKPFMLSNLLEVIKKINFFSNRILVNMSFFSLD
ncbi:hypothetical protein BH18THE1_BH18THE1_19740 [soil metagenome]